MKEQQRTKPLISLIAAVIFGTLGVLTLVTGEIQSWTIREMFASGLRTRVVGILYLIMAILLLVHWFRKPNASGK